MIVNGISVKCSHDSANNILEDLPSELAGRTVREAPHTIRKIVNNIIYWQYFSLDLVNGKHRQSPEHAADSWPGDAHPANENEWTEAVRTFLAGLLMGHNSCHLGQIVLLRRLLGSWPPPSGGDTW